MLRAVNFRRPFQLIPYFKNSASRHSRSQYLQLLLVFALLFLIILVLKTTTQSRYSWSESHDIIDAYRSEIESLKYVFPGQSGWLWFLLDTLAQDLIGQPDYQSEDQLRSVIFGVPHNTGLSGSCLAWEVTKAVNRVGGSSMHTPVNFSFADIYCMDDCRHWSTEEDGVPLPDQGRRSNVGSAFWEEYTIEERLRKLLLEASRSGQTVLFINHLQAAPKAALDLLILPRRHLKGHESKLPGSLRLIFYMVHLPPTANLRAWTVSKVRDYIVSLWPNLDPEVVLLLKTRLVGNVVLVRPISHKP